MRGLARGTVALQAHQTEWEQEAARTIRLLADLLGPAASDIQHVGSTAIPAIQAKPIRISQSFFLIPLQYFVIQGFPSNTEHRIILW